MGITIPTMLFPYNKMAQYLVLYVVVDTTGEPSLEHFALCIRTFAFTIRVQDDVKRGMLICVAWVDVSPAQGHLSVCLPPVKIVTRSTYLSSPNVLAFCFPYHSKIWFTSFYQMNISPASSPLANICPSYITRDLPPLESRYASELPRIQGMCVSSSA